MTQPEFSFLKARAFSYARPSTVTEALEAFASCGEDASYIAGGQSRGPVRALPGVCPAKPFRGPPRPPERSDGQGGLLPLQPETRHLDGLWREWQRLSWRACDIWFG